MNVLLPMYEQHPSHSLEQLIVRRPGGVVGEELYLTTRQPAT